MLAGRTGVLFAAFFFGLCGCASAEDRVAKARESRDAEIKKLFASKNLSYPPEQIFLRAFKEDGELELWAGPRKGPLQLVKTFDVCAASGELGPKREQGDGQVPEGFYFIDRFNPRSNFHLSLGLDYPNDSDRLRGKKGRLGGDIFIHGSCVTIGCLPLRDGPIEELYLIALDAKTHGQKRIPVHVFPTRLTDQALSELRKRARPTDALWKFWQELKPGFEAFEKTRVVPRVRVDQKTGAYVVHSM